MTDPSLEAPDQLAAGLTCLMIAYPAVTATMYAWTALLVGASSFAVVLLVWGSIQLLHRWSRYPKGDMPILFASCLMTSLVFFIVSLSGKFPVGIHPLPLLLTPLLLTFQALSLLRETNPRSKAVSRLILLGGLSTGLLVGIGIVRELLSFGTVFSSPVNLPGALGVISTVPAGLILAGWMLGGLRWILGKYKKFRQGGSK